MSAGGRGKWRSMGRRPIRTLGGSWEGKPRKKERSEFAIKRVKRASEGRLTCGEENEARRRWFGSSTFASRFHFFASSVTKVTRRLDGVDKWVASSLSADVACSHWLPLLQRHPVAVLDRRRGTLGSAQLTAKLATGCGSAGPPGIVGGRELQSALPRLKWPADRSGSEDGRWEGVKRLR